MNQQLSTDYKFSTNQPKPVYEVGQTIFHQASHNRFQEYKILDREWDKDAMFGAGCFVYTVHFLEWDNSSRSSLTQERNNWRIAEVNLPVHNLIAWQPKH